MVTDTKLARDEARRVAQHEDVKAELQAEVNRVVAAEGRAEVASERHEVVEVARQLEHRAVREVAATDREVARTRGSARLAQIVDYVFFVIYALIVIEIVLEATGARETNGFKQAMDTITTPFLAPFRGLFADLSVDGYRFVLSYVAGLVVWVLLHLAIRGLIRVIGRRQTTL